MSDTQAKLVRFFDRLAFDSAFFLEALCSVADLRTQTNIAFKHNPAQERYDREVRKNAIGCLDVSTGLVKKFTSPNEGDIRSITSLTVGSDNNIWLTNDRYGGSLGGSIVKLSRNLPFKANIADFCKCTKSDESACCK